MKPFYAPVFTAYARANGILEFHVWDEVSQSDHKKPGFLMDAIARSIPEHVNKGKMNQLSSRGIDKSTFFGDSYDEKTKLLIHRGTKTTQDKRTLLNPKLIDLQGLKIVGGSGEIPDTPNAGGQFAYGFSTAPYGIRASPKHIQQMFNQVVAVILPESLEADIQCWASPELDQVSSYFEDGLEWWGVFLFTIYLPEINRLSVITGSATD